MTEYDIAAARAVLRERGLKPAEIKRFLSKELLSTSEAAFIRGSSTGTVRYLLQQLWGVKAVSRQPGNGENLFPADQVWKAFQEQPGKAWRKGKKGLIGRGPGPRKVTPELRKKILTIYRKPPSKAKPTLADVGMPARDEWTIKLLAEYLSRADVVTLSWETIRKIIREAEAQQ